MTNDDNNNNNNNKNPLVIWLFELFHNSNSKTTHSDLFLNFVFARVCVCVSVVMNDSIINSRLWDLKHLHPSAAAALRTDQHQNQDQDGHQHGSILRLFRPDGENLFSPRSCAPDHVPVRFAPSPAQRPRPARTLLDHNSRSWAPIGRLEKGRARDQKDKKVPLSLQVFFL